MDQQRELPPNVAAAVAELKAALSELYGERLRGVYLFGSYARGDFSKDSDVDVLIILSGPIGPGEEIDRYSMIRAALCLRYDLVISTVPVAEDWFDQQLEPLYQHVVREGVAV